MGCFKQRRQYNVVGRVDWNPGIDEICHELFTALASCEQMQQRPSISLALDAGVFEPGYASLWVYAVIFNHGT